MGNYFSNIFVTSWTRWWYVAKFWDTIYFKRCLIPSSTLHKVSLMSICDHLCFIENTNSVYWLESCHTLNKCMFSVLHHVHVHVHVYQLQILGNVSGWHALIWEIQNRKQITTEFQSAIILIIFNSYVL